MELKGYYLDGETAEKKDAVVRVETAGLAIDLPGGERILWSYAEIRQNRDFSGAGRIRLERGGLIPETLVLSRAGFSAAITRTFPGSSRPLPGPAPRPKRLAYAVLAGLGAAGIVVSLYLWGIPFFSSFAASHVPVSWEENLGRSVAETLAPFPKRCSDSDQTVFLREIVDILTASLPRQTYKFQLIVLDAPEENAFAAPGGRIVVHRGLLEKVRTAEEIAGILAHEMQHVLLRHSTRMLLEQASWGLLLAVIAGDADSAMKMGKEGAGLLGTLRYGRRLEEQADAEGMRLLLEAGIDPRGIISFFEKIQEEEGESAAVTGYFSTHPSPASRIERMKTIAGESRRKTFRPLPPYDGKKILEACGKKERG